jgi:hypothetical protein
MERAYKKFLEVGKTKGLFSLDDPAKIDGSSLQEEGYEYSKCHWEYKNIFHSQMLGFSVS